MDLLSWVHTKGAHATTRFLEGFLGLQGSLQDVLLRLGNFLAWETARKWENSKIAPENARGDALQNRGAPGSAREGAFPAVFLH